ncbi:MAG: carbohydrate ABC transporter permease [Hamadaea sp.]|uniref:carbohydrate ABC transporter permease n=1 Tax=Hamadaea sp. TaxID=2024425 RepID=UPI0017B2F5FD|nr:carbohydrate ABC transporter permease [Hamadaea sp.]NUT18564.1 carbohydrate ABC transporter permease [Hamadaea sp.]
MTRLLVTIGKVFLAGLFLLSALFPLAWMLIAGFKSKTEVVQTPFQFFPEVWRWENYTQILEDPAFLRSIGVTFVGALLFAALSLVVNSLGAYAFARLDFAFKRTLWVVVITTMFIPGIAIMLTSFIVVTQLHMLDTMAVLVVPGAASGLQVFFLRQYYLGVPVALEEAALIDGAGRWRIFLHIFTPISKGALVVVGVTSFLAFWNAYVWPVLTITDANLFQIQQYLATFRSDRSSELGLLMAGSTLAALPVILLFLAFQKQIIGGIRISGMK